MTEMIDRAYSSTRMASAEEPMWEPAEYGAPQPVAAVLDAPIADEVIL